MSAGAAAVAITQRQAPLPMAPVEIARRLIPYPYRAMLAICSDLDETPDLDTYLETLRFLNTCALGRWGQGLGLETGDTMYFDMPPGHLSYWNTDDRGRATIRTLIQSGHIDCLHSFGDLTTTRAQAARTLDELDRHGCRLETWIAHAVAPSNFGGDIMRGAGDQIGSPVYHADLTYAYGIRYVWRGRVTSVAGQEVSRDLRGTFHSRHPIASTCTLAKELTKGVLSRVGSRKYRLHAPNRLLDLAQLRDGHTVYEFVRANPHWGGVSRGDNATGLGTVLDLTVPRLIARGGASILYTHLGKGAHARRPLAPATVDGLRRLAQLQAAGTILVTTTRRLLGYWRATRDTNWCVASEGDHVRLDVRTNQSIGPPRRRDLDGLTFYVPNPASTTMTIDGAPVAIVRRNASDQSGRGSISLPWTRLEFPEL